MSKDFLDIVKHEYKLIIYFFQNNDVSLQIQSPVSTWHQIKHLSQTEITGQRQRVRIKVQGMMPW